MGTYMYCQLKNTDDANIKKCNDELETLGFPVETYNGVKYGPFVTMEQLTEDARFMNEDPEGLKQAPGLKRPIKPKDLTDFFWNRIGLFCLKLSGGSTREELERALIVAHWAQKHRSKIDPKECSYHTPAKVRSYIPPSD